MKNIYVCISLFVLCFVLYGNSLGNGFFLDDYSMLVNDSFIHNINNLTRLNAYVSDRQDGIKHFRPVSIVFRAVLYLLFKDKGFYYHLINIFLFGLYCWLFFRLVECITNDFQLAWISALLFCAHPVNHIFVNYVTDHEILLMGIFSALTAIHFLKYLKAPHLRWRYFVSILFFPLCLLTQEIAVILPVFLLSLALIAGKKGIKHALGLSFPYFICASLFIVFKLFIAGHVFEFLKADVAAQFTFLNYFSSLARLLGWYVSRLFYPVDIVFIFSALETDRSLWFMTFAVVIMMGGLICAVSQDSNQKLKDIRNIALIWLFYGFAVLPFLCFVYITAMGMIIEPHWFFFSSGGFFLLLALVWQRIQARFSQKYGLGALVILICFWGFLTIRYNQLWKTGRTYAEYWISRVPHNPYGLRFLGHAALRRGDLQQAAYYLGQVMPYGLNYASFIELAQVYLKRGKPDSAKRILAQGIKKMPGESALYNDLGAIYFAEGRYSETVRLFKKAVELDRSNTTAWENLIDTHILLKDFNGAIIVLEHLLENFDVGPDKKKVYLAKLSACFYLLNDKVNSQKAFEEFFRERPGADDIQAFGNMCSALGIPKLSDQVSASTY